MEITYIPNNETKLGPIEIQQINFFSREDAVKAWEILSPTDKESIAKNYKYAFADPDLWAEVGLCQCCGRYTSTMEACDNNSCGNQDSKLISEAYNIDDLINKDLPESQAEFTPGLMLLARSSQGEVVGTVTGGITTLGELIQSKYQLEDPAKILNSIIAAAQSGFTNPDKGDNRFLRVDTLTPETKVFYLNEAFVRNDMQQKSIGTALSAARINALAKISPDTLVCSRSINQRWINTNIRILSQKGYEVVRFIPEGDNYRAKGRSREFYLAKPIISQQPWVQPNYSRI